MLILRVGCGAEIKGLRVISKLLNGAPGLVELVRPPEPALVALVASLDCLLGAEG
jgi:hypothetical protein